MPERTQYGKWVIYRTDDGKRMERWPVDARRMLETDEFVAEPSEGAEAPPAAEPEPDPEPRVIGIEAERVSRLRGQWDKATPPADYLERYGEETEAGQLARKIVDAEAEAANAERPVTGEAGPAKPVSLPGQG